MFALPLRLHERAAISVLPLRQIAMRVPERPLPEMSSAALRVQEERAGRAMAVISENFNSKQQVFLDFVLSHYIAVGVEELDQTKLTPLLKLKYHDSIADAVADLGRPDEIGKVFSGFQKYLYQVTRNVLLDSPSSPRAGSSALV